MRRNARTARNLGLATAAAIGSIGFIVDPPWAYIAVGANLLLVAAVAGYVRVQRMGPSAGAEDYEDYEDADPTPPLPERSLVRPYPPTRRSRVVQPAAPTSRLRKTITSRQVQGPRGQRESAGAPMVEISSLAEQVQLLDAYQRRSWRDQLWWVLAGAALSVPIGVAINLATG